MKLRLQRGHRTILVSRPGGALVNSHGAPALGRLDDSSRHIRLDNVTIAGTVPEPPAFAFATTAALVLAVVGRWRRSETVGG